MTRRQTAMVRFQSYFPLDLYEQLTWAAKVEGKSLAEIVRKAVGSFLARYSFGKEKYSQSLFQMAKEAEKLPYKPRRWPSDLDRELYQ